MDTVTVKTCELIGPALDWAVAKCEGVKVEKFPESPSLFYGKGFDKYRPSTDWLQGGPIIERELIRVIAPTMRGIDWIARIKQGLPSSMHGWFEKTGPAPLIAAMRCYVASKLGDTVQIPRELVP
jgi:hypothetical protein